MQSREGQLDSSVTRP
nr:unnamed protein product [Callosobruchus chinensis]CAH7723072.1 unnamed protein product [Callosobruchus chinensis]CAH7729901.1 unnamed protein product [Callosobruchus chinensis]CAH7730942.1 unnamed protein product [Callosobruchus chinensis]CAH7737627.1 unnamed protein product [Callosobruchus chinensis]